MLKKPLPTSFCLPFNYKVKETLGNSFPPLSMAKPKKISRALKRQWMRDCKRDRLDRLLATHDTIYLIDTERVAGSLLTTLEETLSLANDGWFTPCRRLSEGGGLFVGQNKQIRRAIKEFCASHPESTFGELLPHISGQVGLVFTNDDWVTVDDCLRIQFDIVPQGVCLDLATYFPWKAPTDLFRGFICGFQLTCLEAWRFQQAAITAFSFCDSGLYD